MEYTIEFLKNCDVAYHNGEELLISDYDYDIINTKVRQKYPDDPYFSTVGAPVTGEEFDLPYVLGSLDKMKYDGSLNQWIQERNIKVAIAGDKLDGCTIYTRYEDGKLVHATTRGDGYVGRDITEKARLFCPPCKEKGTVELKGEVMAFASVAKTLKDKKGNFYKKARAFVSGTLNRPNTVKYCEHLHVEFFQVLNQDFPTYAEHLGFIRQDCGLPTVYAHLFSLDNMATGTEDYLSILYKERKELSKWDIDGLVVMDNSHGNNTDEYYPDNAVAYKISEDAVPTVVTKIEWEIKRSGKLMPVVHLEPVDISGSTVTKATGFNAAFIRDNEIIPGKKIGVFLSGEVIPMLEIID